VSLLICAGSFVLSSASALQSGSAPLDPSVISAARKVLNDHSRSGRSLDPSIVEAAMKVMSYADSITTQTPTASLLSTPEPLATSEVTPVVASMLPPGKLWTSVC
jgi:hypothetical protein